MLWDAWQDDSKIDYWTRSSCLQLAKDWARSQQTDKINNIAAEAHPQLLSRCGALAKRSRQGGTQTAYTAPDPHGDLKAKAAAAASILLDR